jgi:hypothetical protein
MTATTMKAFALVLSLLLYAGGARADVVAPNSDCHSRKVGDPCGNGGYGTCQRFEACASSRHGSMCIGCVVDKDAGVAAAKADGGTLPAKDSGCSLGGDSATSHAGSWLLAGTCSFLVLFAFRRRARKDA